MDMHRRGAVNVLLVKEIVITPPDSHMA